MFNFLKKYTIAYIAFGLGTIFGSTIGTLTTSAFYGPMDSDKLNAILEKCAPGTAIIVPSGALEEPDSSSDEKVVLFYIQH
jgi:hypothetical protein